MARFSKNFGHLLSIALGASFSAPLAQAWDFHKPCQPKPNICGSKILSTTIVSDKADPRKTVTLTHYTQADLKSTTGYFYRAKVTQDDPFTRKCNGIALSTPTYTISDYHQITDAKIPASCKPVAKKTTKPSEKKPTEKKVAAAPGGNAKTGEAEVGGNERQVQTDTKVPTPVSPEKIVGKPEINSENVQPKSGNSTDPYEQFRAKTNTVTGSDEHGKFTMVPGPDGTGAKKYTSGDYKGKIILEDDTEDFTGKDRFEVTGGKTYDNRTDWMKNDGNKNGTITYKNGATATYKDGKLIAATDKNGNAVMKEQFDANNSKEKASSDECFNSEELGGAKMRCNTTYTVAKTTEVTNQVLQGVGRNVVNQIGNSAAQRMQNGYISGGQEAAAKMAKSSFTYESGLGVANVAAAAILAKQNKKHAQNIATLRAEKKTADWDANDAGNSIAQERKGKYEAAITEQKLAKQRAKEATYVAAMAGAQALAGAVTAKQMQKAAEKNAALDRANRKLVNENSAAYDSNPLFNTTVGSEYDPNQMAATDGTETNRASQTDTSGGTDVPFAGLGKGQDLTGVNDGGPVGPKAGAFRAGTGSGGGGGGGAGAGGGGGGGLGAPGAPEAADDKAAYASEFATKERYETGGTAGGKGGADGKGGEKDEGGIDLNGLLAQFLPKDEKDIGPQNGILDFAGNRGVATEEPEASFLDKNADLFQRIHETMTEKNRKGHVGI